jgi:ATP citrate (pro-S)-lyase
MNDRPAFTIHKLNIWRDPLMSAKAIREYHGKKLVSRWLPSYSDSVKFNIEDRVVSVGPDTSLEKIAIDNPWLTNGKLVVKPDQLIKRRGKAGLLGINKTWPEVVQWINERMNKEQKVEVVTGILNNFIIEPFVPHAQSDEYYICLQVKILPTTLDSAYQFI